MDAYSIHQVYVVAACAVAVAAFIAITPFAKRSGAPSPILGVSMVVALVGILGFSLTEYAAGGASSPILDVAIKYLRNVPIVSAVSYACLVQATYYSMARNSARVRKTLKSAPFVICGGFLISGVAEAWQQPPMLEVREPLSGWTLIYNSTTVVPLAFYGAFAAYVFLRAVREPFAFANLRNRVRRNLQNTCGAVVMGSFTALACSTFLWYCGRVLLSQQRLNNLAAAMSHLQMVFIATLILAVLVGIVCYCSQDEHEKVMEQLARIAEPVCDLTEILAAAPVSDSKMNKAYVYVKQAAGDDFLGLSDADASRADDAFRAGAVMNVGWAHETGGGYDGIQSRDLLHLAKMHDEAPHSTRTLLDHDLASGREDGVRERLDTSSHALHDVISLVKDLDNTERLPNLGRADKWAQLAALGLAEAGALQARISRELLSGWHVSEEVYNHYSLAKLKLTVDPY